MSTEKIRFEETFSYNLIYVFRINDKAHEGSLKVGLSTVKFKEDPSSIGVNHQYLIKAAKHRIDQYTKTAGIVYELLHTELAITNKNVAFRDQDVHRVLLNSGVKKVELSKGANEWFKTDLNTVKNAIKAVKDGRTSLFSSEVTKTMSPIVLRPNQQEAVDKTIKQFKNSDSMLWNAKMRFGKTLSALQVIKELKFKKTIIMTHRPVVDDGWYEDFEKIFYDTKTYKYGSKSSTHGDSIESLEREGVNYVYFASIQDLRGSSTVGGKFNKNDKVFSIDWDLVIVDEAHEGTGTSLGEEVIKQIVKPDSKHKTKLLELSGTPFNLLGKFDENQIYTWDYVMEQREKMNWYINHYGDPNPYEDLPKMHIFTYDLDKLIDGYIDVEDKAFNFREFFRVWTDNPSVDRKIMPKYAKVGEFVHKEDVKAFLDLLCKEDKLSNYPYSTKEYREYFRHSLWMVPGVKEAKALSKLMHEHEVFGSGAFEIVNVAGEGDDFEEKHYQDAKKMVEDAITSHPKNTYTITLSCGRLTTGVSIKAWTAIFMLSGSASVSAQNYLQTIFRAQTPAKIGGRVKDSCYVFDFAPDRTLNMVAQASELSPKPGVVDPDGKTQMREFLNFCPVIGIDGSSMEFYSVDTMMQQLKKAHAEQVVRNGFEDKNLYNDNLLKLDDLEIKEFNDLRDIIGASKAQSKTTQIDINNQGMTDEDWDKVKEARNKNKKELTEEQKAALEKLKEAKSQQKKAIDILRGISIRIPMLIYGADIDFETDVTLDNFLDLVDDISWEEFMPNGVTKEKFKHFSKYYDVDVFIVAGRKIRNIAKSADKLNPTERAKKIAGLFATFKNPDKETVLTPWRVVNMHMSDTLGGWCFYDKTFDELNGKLDEPRYVSQGAVTFDTLSTDSSKILEINSKSGLYPLYVTYSIYKQRCLNCDTKKLDETKEKELWKQTIKNNIYVVCRTKMAATITKRTLNGYDDAEFNIVSYENIIDEISKNSDKFVKEINSPKTWKKEGERMKFNAVVGNPPYQEEGEGTRKSPIYHYFYDASFRLSNIASLITPARFLFNAGQTPKTWNEKMLNDEHLKVVKLINNSREVFETVEIKGGVVIMLRNANETYGAIGQYIEDPILNGIVKKVKDSNSVSINSIHFNRSSYRLTEKVYEENNELLSRVKQSEKFSVTSNIFEKFPEIFMDNNVISKQGYIHVLGRFNNNRVKKFIKEEYISSHDNLSKWKVFVAKSNGTGKFGETFSPLEIGEPNDIATQTFISFGKFETKYEAESLAKYLKTKFVRLLLSVYKVTPDNARKEVWELIPLQDFSTHSNINWEVVISKIDEQLYKKYNLTKEEIDFIEKNVKSMD